MHHALRRATAQGLFNQRRCIVAIPACVVASSFIGRSVGAGCAAAVPPTMAPKRKGDDGGDAGPSAKKPAPAGFSGPAPAVEQLVNPKRVRVLKGGEVAKGPVVLW